MTKNPTNLRGGLGTAVLVLALASAAPLFAADYPLLPPDDTGKLYATEKACDCVLAFSVDGSTIEVLVRRIDLGVLLAIPPGFVSLNRSGIVATDYGSIIFTVNDTEDEDASSLVERASDGTLSVVVSGADILLETGGTNLELRGLVFGYYGMLYTIENRSRSLLQIDPISHTVVQFASSADFEGTLVGANFGAGAKFDAEIGSAADENYIYIADDGVPAAVYRVDYFGTVELHAGGPGVDPISLEPAYAIFYHNSGSGTFEVEVTTKTDEEVKTDPIPWNASAAVVEAAINAVDPGAVTVSGSGIEADPWIATWQKYGEFERAFPFITTPDECEWQAANGADEVQAIGTVGTTTGFVAVRIERFCPQENITVGWPFDASAATVQSEIELGAGPWFTPGDIGVTGTGSLSDPWVLTFQGGLSKVGIEVEPFLVTDGELYVGDMVDAGAFQDPDGTMTRRGDGSLMIQDTGDGNFLYQIDTFGTTTTFMSEWEVMKAAGNVSMEGGTAYDSSDNLYAWGGQEESPVPITGSKGQILKIAPDKSVTSFATDSQIAAEASVNAEDVSIESIAFERLVTVAPVLPGAITTIDTLLADPSTSPAAARHLNRAKAKLERAETLLANVPPNPSAALRRIRQAMRSLERSVRRGIDPADVVPTMDSLTGLSRDTANDAIADAISRGANPNRIAKAQQSLADGDSLRTSGEFSRAVSAYRSALRRALRA